MRCPAHLRRMSETTNLKGRKILVTGGSAGIGKAATRPRCSKWRVS
jgi:NADP-dependent 3-hydroxy acid dehydrogenase YdfG